MATLWSRSYLKCLVSTGTALHPQYEKRSAIYITRPVPKAKETTTGKDNQWRSTKLPKACQRIIHQKQNGGTCEIVNKRGIVVATTRNKH